MQIIVNHSSMVPIYEQIVEQIKAQIMEGKLQAEAVLPSGRTTEAGRGRIGAGHSKGQALRPDRRGDPPDGGIDFGGITCYRSRG